MNVFGLQIPNKSLSNFDLTKYADDLDISNFRGVFMRDELPKFPQMKILKPFRLINRLIKYYIHSNFQHGGLWTANS